MSVRRIRGFRLLTMSLGRPLYIWKAPGLREGWSIPTPGRVCGQWRAEIHVGRDYQTRTGLAGGRSNKGFIGWDDRTHPRRNFIRPHPLLPAVVSTADAGADLFAGKTERTWQRIAEQFFNFAKHGWNIASVLLIENNFLSCFFGPNYLFLSPSFSFPPALLPLSCSPTFSLSLSYWFGVHILILLWNIIF